MKRKLLVAILTLALFAALGTVVYANHVAPATTATVSLTSNAFDVDGHIYGGVKGGITVPGDAATGLYTWSITNNDKKRHIFEVEEVGGGELVDPNFPKGHSETVEFTLSSGKTYKIYCPLHEKTGMVFYLVTP